MLAIPHLAKPSRFYSGYRVAIEWLSSGYRVAIGWLSSAYPSGARNVRPTSLHTPKALPSCLITSFFL